MYKYISKDCETYHMEMSTGKYVIYLRKSRADKEAELHGEGETLSRHEKLLTEYAAEHGLYIDKIYREIVSGETISSRPEVQKLLENVAEGNISGVLVVEIERLARGDTMDQGYIAGVFKASSTKIITPFKTYDPNNEFDEEYFEFGLFMSRREYKTINRRIQRGRIASVSEGKYIASTAPYGYERIKLNADRGWTLSICEAEASAVRLIFDMYANGLLLPDGSRRRMGLTLIAKELDALGIKPRSGHMWSRSSVKDILHNPTYTGRVRWQSKTQSDCILTDGLHPAIIDDSVFNRVQQLIQSSAHTHVCTPGGSILKNPLSGLIYCRKCGSLLTRTYSNTKAGYYVLKCPCRYCDNISAPLELIEKAVISALDAYISPAGAAPCSDSIAVRISDEIAAKQSVLCSLSRGLASCTSQLERTYTLLEQGIYTADIFARRRAELLSSIAVLKRSVADAQSEYSLLISEQSEYRDFVPATGRLSDIYYSLKYATDKNNMLKKLVSRAEYLKEKKNVKGKGSTASFELTLLPKMRGNI